MPLMRLAVLVLLSGCMTRVDHAPSVDALDDDSPLLPCGQRTLATSSNTGWAPTGVTLSPYTGPSTLRSPVELVGVDIATCLSLESSNIVIRRSRIRSSPGCSFSAVNIPEGMVLNDILLEDVEIDGARISQYGIRGSGFTLRRVHVHGASSAVQFLGSSPSVVESSSVHTLDAINPANPISAAGTAHVVLRASSFEANDASDGAITLSTKQGEVDDILVRGNFVDGGGWTVRAGSTPYGLATFTRFIGNCWGRRSIYGAVTDWDPRGEGNTWTDNVFLDSGEEVPW